MENFYTRIFQGTVCHKFKSLKKCFGCLSSLLIYPSMTKKPKDSLKEWKDAWCGLYKNEISENDIDDKNKINEDLLDAIHNILGP